MSKYARKAAKDADREPAAATRKGVAPDRGRMPGATAANVHIDLGVEGAIPQAPPKRRRDGLEAAVAYG